MSTSFRLLALGCIITALAACGTVHHSVPVAPVEVASLRPVAIEPVEVSSKEQNEDATALNQQWREVATEALSSALRARSVPIDPAGACKVRCRIELVYGNRALRHFVGFGAGKGSTRITIELLDPNGVVKYATESKADLHTSGDMRAIARKSIDAAAKEFASRL